VEAGAGAASELLVVGGEDHKTGQADDAGRRYARLEAWARERFPVIDDIAFRWSGQVMESIDGLAFIGRDGGSEQVYVVTGDSGMGMTHGTIAGMLLADLILGRENRWASLYDPTRTRLGAAAEFLKENVNVALQYADWVAGADGSLDAIPCGSGAVVRRGIARVAVYRDDGGTVHQLSATCPHLGCSVRWNSSEKTWDCPCHGSRFNARGHVLNGPANRDLAPHGEIEGEAGEESRTPPLSVS
jgi:Rieske Fe-S protein